MNDAVLCDPAMLCSYDVVLLCYATVNDAILCYSAMLCSYVIYLLCYNIVNFYTDMIGYVCYYVVVLYATYSMLYTYAIYHTVVTVVVLVFTVALWCCDVLSPR